jgi:site-specific DNA-cytosine methylase
VKDFAIDRSDLASLYGSVRLFDPEEMLLISGFPTWFKFPENFPLRKKFSCIGNSVNITVVRAVMQSMFNNGI